MLVKTIFCGFGGQGVLMMGISLANSAMKCSACFMQVFIKIESESSPRHP